MSFGGGEAAAAGGSAAGGSAGGSGMNWTALAQLLPMLGGMGGGGSKPPPPDPLRRPNPDAAMTLFRLLQAQNLLQRSGTAPAQMPPGLLGPMGR